MHQRDTDATAMQYVSLQHAQCVVGRNHDPKPAAEVLHILGARHTPPGFSDLHQSAHDCFRI